MNNPVEFTDKEQFLLSYYRDDNLSRWQRQAALQALLLFISLFFLALFLIQHDPGWGAVAYGLLLWRAAASIWRARYYTPTYRSIIAKYDAKISDLMRTAESNQA